MRFLLLSILLLTVICGSGQDTISGVHSKLILEPKVYLISGTVSIDNKLEIKPGARLFFANGASVIITGSLLVAGTKNNPVLFKSIPGEKGSGFVIRNNSSDSIQIQGAHFENLIIPILFDKDWSRNSVLIESCEFVQNKSSNPVLYVQRPKFSFGQEEISGFDFILQKNLFAENESPVYFEDLSTDLMRFIIKENSFVENSLYDYGAYNFSSNILFGRADKFSSNFKPIISNNSFVNNRLINSSVDTLSQLANFGIYGTDDSVVIDENYWGINIEKEVKKSIYDYSFNYTSPQVKLKSILNRPNSTLPPHIFSIVKNYSDTLKTDSLSNLFYDQSFKLNAASVSQFVLIANTAINFSTANLTWVYLSDSAIINEKKIDFTLDGAAKSTFCLFKFDDKTIQLFLSKAGYLKIDGLIGLSGEYIPTIKLGYTNFLKDRFVFISDKNKNGRGAIIDSNISVKQITNPTYFKFKKKTEIGVIGIFGWYYGTLSNKKLLKNDVNTGVGIQFRRSVSKYISISFSAYKISLSGSDLRSNDTAKVARGMSFRSPVMGGIATIHYSLKNNLLYGIKTRLIPELAIGVEYLKFNPQGQYKGIWYNLQTLGTAGQTSMGSTLKPYSLSTLGVPLSFAARLILNKHTTFSFYGQYHFLMTNYLDDVGADQYVSPIKIQVANPSNPEAAVYFSNPSYRSLQNGQMRSSIGEANDGYFSLGINLSYHF